MGSAVYSLSDDATDLLETLPAALQKLRRATRDQVGHSESTIEKVQKAAVELEKATQVDTPAAPSTVRGVTRVQIEKPKLDVRDYLWTGTIGLVALIGQITVVCFLTYFLVASGNTFRRKLVKIAGPTFSEKKITVQVLDEITAQIQRYLLVQVGISLALGVAIWLAFLWIGVEHAAVWGVFAGILNLIPYIGPIVITVGAALVGFLQFGTVEMAMLIGGVSLIINTLEGYLLAPWLTSRASRMNPVVVFTGVLAWGWLWGGWGLVLGIPILMIVKAVCDHVEDLKPIAELLGD
jgi:predicted PurR-regulated permease PerM